MYHLVRRILERVSTMHKRKHKPRPNHVGKQYCPICSPKKPCHHHHHQDHCDDSHPAHAKPPIRNKRVALPKAVHEALHHLLFHEGWKKRDLFYELGRPILNPVLSTSAQMQTLFLWVASEEGRYDLLLKAVDDGFYIENSPEARLQEYLLNLEKLDEPHRTFAIRTVHDVLSIFGIPHD